MAEPDLADLGNLRLLTRPWAGPPPEGDDPLVAVDQAIGDQGLTGWGPVQVFYSAPPTAAMEDWEARLGRAVTGLPRSRGDLLVEDYRNLQVLELPLSGPLADLARLHRRLADHATAHGWRLRPYWRVTVGRSRTADGAPWPRARVGVFLDR